MTCLYQGSKLRVLRSVESNTNIHRHQGCEETTTDLADEKDGPNALQPQT